MAARRDERVFLEVTLPHLDAVHGVARHLARDAAQVDDLVQETYLRAFAKFSPHVLNPRAWLIAICVNVARSDARRLRRRPDEQFGDVPEGQPDSTPEVVDQVMASLDRATVARGLAKLPEAQRVCLVLMDLVGLTAAETAEALDCPRGTVLARVHRGRRALAQVLIKENARP